MSESSLPLVTRAQDRDPAAVEALLLRHLPGLQGWLRLRMGAQLRARETPEDLVQSVAREVLADLGGFEWRGEAAFRHWLYVKAQRKLVDKARFVAAECRSPARERPGDVEASDGVLAGLAAGGESPSRAVQSREEVARIERAFAELPADYQEAISLQRLCGMDYTEIAARMQRSEGATRNLVHRGLSRLALRLAELRRAESETKPPVQP
jgi:RNA polymerase sigma factor (sigma-70 family)